MLSSLTPPSHADSEFGVPFPGRVLPRARWTTTGLRPPAGPFDWSATFGREAPRVVDLGCGNGRYLIGSALARPTHDHLGVDLVQVAVDWAARRANRRGLANVRFAVGDAVEWLFERFATASLDEVHVYHPQPYYEAGAAARRLLNPAFFDRLWTVLRPAGLLVLQTDNRAYWKYLERAAEKHFVPARLPGPWPDAPRGRTRREIEARRKGLVVWRMEARRRERPLDVGIPEPEFDADRPAHRKRKRREA
jgi:tRNA (guanine-N7-)-methyltransferase